MIYFGIRDAFWVLLYRLLGFRFGSFGKRVRFEHPLHMIGARHIHIEDDALIQNGAYLNVHPLGETAELRFGARCLVGHHVHIVCSRRVEIGQRVLIADRVFITDCGHEYRDVTTPVADQGLRQLADTVIGEGSWIGENACVIGCRIGRNCVVAANSVVLSDVPDHCVAAGAPAVIAKRYCPERKAWLRTRPGGEFDE